MTKTLYLDIDDDITRAVRKIQRDPAQEIILALPKGSLLFSNMMDLSKLKAQTDALGKTIFFLTMDPKGREKAQAAGFELKELDMLRRPGPPMDMARPQQPKPVLRKTADKTTIAVAEPGVAAPVVAAKPVITAAQPPATTEHIMEVVPPVKPKRKRGLLGRFFRSTLLTTATALILILAVLVGFLLPQATITVYAAPQPIQRDLDINLDVNTPQASAEQLALPAKIFSSPEQQTLQFQTSGTVDLGNKAHGTVQIYNLTGQTLRLKAATTTFTYNSYVFHLAKDASGIKPTKTRADSSPDPTSLTSPVDVVADQGGDAYNLPIGTRLEISNPALGSSTNQLYAIATADFSGGATRMTATIVQKDLDNATKQLNDALFQSANQQLINTQHLTIIPSGSKVNIENISFDKKVGDQSLTFFGTASGSIKALAYDPEQLKTLVEQRVKITLDEDKMLATETKEVINASFKNVDIDAGKGVLSVHFESLVETNFNQQTLSNQLKGKTEQDIKGILMGKDGVDSVNVHFFPGWIKTAPKIPGRVKIVVKTP